MKSIAQILASVAWLAVAVAVPAEPSGVTPIIEAAAPGSHSGSLFHVQQELVSEDPEDAWGYDDQVVASRPSEGHVEPPRFVGIVPSARVEVRAGTSTPLPFSARGPPRA